MGGEGVYYVGRYPVHALLGRGGFGSVYLGAHPDSGEPVAVKVLDQVAADDPRVHAAVRGELHAEAQALVRVRDPHCVRVYEVLDQDGVAALVTEFIDGVSLREVLGAQGRLVAQEALGVLRGALRGLVAVHGVGLVHGDLKPDNVLLDGRGVSHLIDFGLAAPPRLIADAQGWGSGTPAYLAPEKIVAGLSDARTDLYAAAVILFELLVGHKPFVGSVEEVLDLQVHAPVPDPRSFVADMGDDLAALCMAGLAKDPSQRPQSAVDFLGWLEQAAASRYGRGWAAGTGGVVGGVVGALLATGSAPAVLAAPSAVGGVAGGVLGGAGAAGAGGVVPSAVSGVTASSAVATSAGTTGTLLPGIPALVAIATTAAIVVGSAAWLTLRDDPVPPVEQVATTPTPQPTAKVAPALNTDIRDFSLDNARWVNAVGGNRVRLRSGRFDGSLPGGIPYSYVHGADRAGGKDLFLDLDGDGDEDVVAPLTLSNAEEGGETLWYVWIWDAETGRARQLTQPIAKDNACETELRSIRTDDNVVVVEERLGGLFAEGQCEQAPDVASTRRIALRQGVPVLTNGLGGYGGVCPEVPAFGLGLSELPEPDEEQIQLYAGPRTSLALDDPRIESSQPLFGYGNDLAPPRWLQVDGWAIVEVKARGVKARTCAWAKVPKKPELIDYRPGTTLNEGVVVSDLDDLDELVGASEDFKQFIAGQLDQLQQGATAGCRSVPAITVGLLRADGFARGGVGIDPNGPTDCAAGGDAIWALKDGTWQVVSVWNGELDCALLVSFRVPDEIVEYPTCFDSSSGRFLDLQ